MRPLFDDAFADRHIPMKVTGAKIEELCFLRGPYREVSGVGKDGSPK
jgi:hypothetical protein